MSIIDINGTELSYREIGNRDRNTIVLAHPVLFDSTVFAHLISELAGDFHLILPDIHGHGRSGFRAGMRLDDMVEDNYQLLTKLNLSKPTWIGYSIGGMLGMRLALAHPGLLDSLILIATTARTDPPQIREATWQLWQMFRDGHREDIADAALPFFFAAATFENQPQLVANYRSKIIAYKQEQAEGMFEAARAVFDRDDISDQINAIKVPTLAIGGKEDPLSTPVELELIAARIPNARLKIIEEAGHLLMVEKSQQVTEIVRGFLTTEKAVGHVTAS